MKCFIPVLRFAAHTDYEVSARRLKLSHPPRDCLTDWDVRLTVWDNARFPLNRSDGPVASEGARRARQSGSVPTSAGRPG